MKPIHLNLASRPYRDDRPFYVAVALLAVAVGFLMLNNIQTAVQYFSATKTTRGEIANLESAIAAEQTKAANAGAAIKGIDLRTLNKRISYVNSEIAERAFSWSALLDQLERVLPNNVKITSLAPSVSKDGTTHLELVCSAKEGQGVIQMLNRMLSDPHFARPFPRTETKTPGGTEDFTLSVDYRPDGATLLTTEAR